MITANDAKNILELNLIEDKLNLVSNMINEAAMLGLSELTFPYMKKNYAEFLIEKLKNSGYKTFINYNDSKLIKFTIWW